MFPEKNASDFDSYIILSMSLGQIIRKKCESLHLMLDEVAAFTNFPKTYLSAIETGRVPPPLMIDRARVNGLYRAVIHSQKL